MVWVARTTPGSFSMVLTTLLDIDDRADVPAAVADEDADPRLFIGDIVLVRDTSSSTVRVLRAEASSSMAIDAAPLACVTVSGMSLGSWNAPPTKTPGRDVDSGCEPVRRAEAVFIELDAELRQHSTADCEGSRPTASTTRSNSSSRELAVFIEEADARIHRPRHLDDARGNALDVADAVLVLGPLVVLVEILAVGADVHVEDRRFQARRVVLGDHAPASSRPCSRSRSSIRCRTWNRASRRTESRRSSWLRAVRRAARHAPRTARRPTASARTGRWSRRSDTGRSRIRPCGAASNSSKPGVRMTEPTSSSTVRSPMRWSMAFCLQASTHSLHSEHKRAVQASLRLGQGLLFGQARLHLLEVAHSLGHGQFARLGARPSFRHRPCAGRSSSGTGLMVLSNRCASRSLPLR